VIWLRFESKVTAKSLFQTRRPAYTKELQKVCLEVRRRNCGIDGKPILFYTRRTGTVVSSVKPRRKSTTAKNSKYAEVVEGVKSLGLTSATAAQVEAAVSQRYKMGIVGVDLGEVIRIIFLDLKRQDSGDNVR
jgi:hypothetical protein